METEGTPAYVAVKSEGTPNTSHAVYYTGEYVLDPSPYSADKRDLSEYGVYTFIPIFYADLVGATRSVDWDSITRPGISDDPVLSLIDNRISLLNVPIAIRELSDKQTELMQAKVDMLKNLRHEVVSLYQNAERAPQLLI